MASSSTYAFFQSAVEFQNDLGEEYLWNNWTIIRILFYCSINTTTGRHKNNGNFWKTRQKLKKSNNENFIDRNWTIHNLPFKRQ